MILHPGIVVNTNVEMELPLVYGYLPLVFTAPKKWHIEKIFESKLTQNKSNLTAMKLAIVTVLPPRTESLSTYGHELVKHLREQVDMKELILITDRTNETEVQNFEYEGCKLAIQPCWDLNGFNNLFKIGRVLSHTRPDGVLLNMQLLKFDTKKNRSGFGLLLPMLCRIKRIPVITLVNLILPQ
ncbi:hypothetical protein [uncultured Eudoraea sp.]|uniref:hypothetical protein n=1 Tax=uncultured Eudoraea sp. TaxID=1035614 RepID=UPI00262AAE55|nr:hypothetical protein [uncultured Eudoraea sp.]